MKQFLLYVLTSLLLATGPAWALHPLSSVVIPNGTTMTLTGAPNSTTTNNNFYPSVEIQSGGTGIFNDGENVRTLIVRTGGTLRFGAAGEVSTPLYDTNTYSYPDASITLETGAIVQLANAAGLPFAQGYYNNTNNNGYSGATTPYIVNGTSTAYYTFNGTAAQSADAPAASTRNGSSLVLSNGIALPATVSRLTLDNPAGLTLVNSTGISQELHVVRGQCTVASGAALTLLSSATGTALLDAGTVATPIAGAGTFAVQRYLDGTLNTKTGYRHLSPPVSGATFASFANGSYTPTVNSAYNTNPASVPAASFPTIFGYIESRVGSTIGAVGFDQGWVSPAATTDVLSATSGYTVNTPPGNVMTFRGLPNTGGYGRYLSRGAEAASGWSLSGNPYPAPINWDVVATTLSSVGATLYVFKSSGVYTGSYASYVPGAGGINGGTNIVPLGQAFFVRVSAGATSGSVNFSDASRFTSYDATASTQVQRTTADSRPRLQLALRDATTTQAHEMLVYFEAAATTGPDTQYDAEYLPGPGQPLTLVSETAGLTYGIDALPALTGADVTVPLYLAATTAGTYTLAVEELRNLPAGYHAYLLDATAGTRLDLAATPSAAITLAANNPVAGRYSVLFSTSTPLATAPAALAELTSLYPNPTRGTTTLRLPAALRAGQATPVRVLNSLGQVVRTATQPATADEFALPLSGLAPGLYMVQAQTAVGAISCRLTVE